MNLMCGNEQTHSVVLTQLINKAPDLFLLPPLVSLHVFKHLDLFTFDIMLVFNMIFHLFIALKIVNHSFQYFFQY